MVTLTKPKVYPAGSGEEGGDGAPKKGLSKKMIAIIAVLGVCALGGIIAGIVVATQPKKEEKSSSTSSPPPVAAPAPPGQMVVFTTTTVFYASGSVDDYTDAVKLGMATNIAAEAGVAANQVEITVEAARRRQLRVRGRRLSEGVMITIIIYYETEEGASSAMVTLTTGIFADADALTAFLNSLDLGIIISVSELLPTELGTAVVDPPENTEASPSPEAEEEEPA